jgi:transcriptional antiterminator NusG
MTAAPMPDKFKWYIIQTYSKAEEKSADKIKEDAEKTGLTSSIKEMYLPKERFATINSLGKQVIKERNIYPGYIFIHCDLNAHLHNLIQNVDKVSGFLTVVAGGKPVEISAKEMMGIKTQSEASMTKEMKEEFRVGETIEIRDGTFGGFHGTIKDVDNKQKVYQVEVTILGRPIMVSLEEVNIRKIGGEE